MFFDVVLVWRFWIILLKIIWRKSTIVSVLYIGAETRELLEILDWSVERLSYTACLLKQWNVVKAEKKKLKNIRKFRDEVSFCKFF